MENTIQMSDERRVLAFFSERLSPKASPKLRQAARRGDFATLWPLWTATVRERVDLLRLETLRERLDWAVPSRTDSSGAGTNSNSEEPFGAILAFYAELLDSAVAIGSVPPTLWVEQLTGALLLIAEAAALDTKPLERQMILGEWRLLLGLLYPELRPFDRFPAQARRSINDDLPRYLDATGFPSVERLSDFRPLLAVWTRSLTLAERVDWPLLSAASQKRLEWAALALCRMTRPDGGWAFEAPGRDDSPVSKRRLFDFYTELFRFDRDATDRPAAFPTLRRLAASADEKARAEAFRRESDSDALTAPWCVSRDSTLAVLRGSWEPDSASLIAAIRSDDRRIQTECSVGGETIFSGTWDLTVRLDGRTLAPVGDWESVCEEAGDERVYWELSLPLEKGVRVERQFLLVPDDGIVLLADAILGAEGRKLEYASRLPLAESVSFKPDAEGREIAGTVNRRGKESPLLRLFPLSLSEWRGGSAGDFVLEDGAATLTALERGPSLYAAFVFDLNRKRLSKPFTWRRLTVGREREKVSDAEAVGFRYQTGNDQYLIYKSLADPVPRSVLGEHFDQDFIFARFKPDGETETILEVERDE